MNIFVTSRHYELSADLKQYAESKIEHLSNFFDQIVNAHVIFALEKYRHFVEVTIHMNGKDINAKDESEDMYTSLDRVVEKLERQILKHKGKLYGKKTPKLSTIEIDLPPEDTEGEVTGEIVPADLIEFPQLSLAEAAEKLKANGKDFSIFANKSTQRLNVIFRREDGSLGLIEAS